MVDACNPHIFAIHVSFVFYYYVFFITIVIAVYLIIAMCFTTAWYCVKINIWPVVWTLSFAAELLSRHAVSA